MPRAPLAAHPRDGDVRAERPRLGLPRQGVGQPLDDGGLQRGEHAVGVLQPDREHVRAARGQPQRRRRAPAPAPASRPRRARPRARGRSRRARGGRGRRASGAGRPRATGAARGRRAAASRPKAASAGADVGRELERREEARAHRGLSCEASRRRASRVTPTSSRRTRCMATVVERSRTSARLAGQVHRRASAARRPRPATLKHTSPTGFSASRRPGPATPVMPDADVGAQRAPARRRPAPRRPRPTPRRRAR